MSRLTALTVPAVLFLFVAASPANAQTPLLPDSVASSGTLRKNYTGFVGMEFGFSTSCQVTSLGRAYFAGNTGTHTVKLVNAATGIDVPGASVQITMSAGATAFEYAALPSPVTLQAGTNYLLLSSETTGGDTWHDLENITPAGGYQNFSIGGAVYSDASGAHIVVPGTAGYSYVPANLLYVIPSTTPGTSVAITAPTSGEILPDAIGTFSATVTGPAGVVSGSTLQFELDGEPYRALQSAPSSGATFNLSIDPEEIIAGSHTLSAIYSAPGSAAVSAAPVTFTVTPANYGNNVRAFIETQSPGALRNNYTGFVGMNFSVAPLGEFGNISDTLEVSCLGRYVWPGNNQSHLLKLVNAATGMDVPGGSVTINLSGLTPGQYAYAYLPVPILLKEPNNYYLVSQETAGGDQWADYGAVTTRYFQINGPVYGNGSASGYQQVAITGNSFGPVNFGYREIFYDSAPVVTVTLPAAGASLTGTVTVQASAVPASTTNFDVIPNSIRSYQVLIDGALVGAAYATGSIPLDTTTLTNGSHSLAVVATDLYYLTGTSAPITITIANGAGTPNTAFLTSFQPTFLRNNYSGFVGMEFTVGAAPIQVASLGRYCASGNSGTHTIKLVQEGNLFDVQGAVTSVNMSGCTVGQYTYAPLASPVTLAAGEILYLVDQETAGGDQWYDFSPVSLSQIATVNGAVYTNSAGGYVLVPQVSTSYVPLNFLHAVGTSGSNSLTTAITSVSDVPNYPSSMTATASANSPITSVQIQIDGYSLTAPLTSAPYTQSVPSINLGQHIFTSVAKDAAGEIATSAPYPYSILTSSTPQNDGVRNLVTYTPGAPRNNYTGWVGFQFTQGPAPAGTPTLMGRNCLSSNTQPHIVKIVRASDGTDIASTWINCSEVNSSIVYSGSTIGPFGFVQSAVLQPNTTYYLVSQETAGGDQFTDIGPATPVVGTIGGGVQTSFFSNFSIDGPVYFDGAKYVLVPRPNYSYASVYFLAIVSGI